MNRDGDSEEDENSEEEVVDWEYVYEEVEEEVYEYESDPMHRWEFRCVMSIGTGKGSPKIMDV